MRSLLALAVASALAGCTAQAPLFTDHTKIPSSTRAPAAVRVGDLDRDGDADAVVLNRSGEELSLHWNAGDGRLAPAVAVDLATGEEVLDLHMAELSGDGLTDLLVLLTSGVAVLTNQGLGQFRVEGEGGRVAPCDGCEAVLPADFTGDGLTDLCVFGDSQGTLLFAGPELQTGVPLDAPGLLSRPAPRLARLDAEAPADLLALSAPDAGGEQVVALLGGGDGAFRVEAGPLLEEGTVRALAAADLDGDGLDDAVVAGAGFVGVFLRTAGGFAPLLRHEVAGLDPMSLGAFDATGDGRPELVVGDADGTVHVFVGAGDLAFLVDAPLQTGPRPSGLAHGDLDGDGAGDLVVTAEGACCPLQGAGLHLFLGGPVPEERVSFVLD